MHGRARNAIAFLAGLALAGSPAYAEPNGQPKIFTRNTSFKLPVQVDDAVRARISQLKLYVRGPDGSWGCHETAAPAQSSFAFKAEKDGEYAFTFVTVDRNGELNPADLENTAPHRVIVVDTLPPDVTLERVPDARLALLRCHVNDPNPDLNTVRVSYFTAAGMWKPLELAQETDLTLFRVPSPAVLESKFRVVAADRAGNLRTKEMTLAPEGGSPYQLASSDGKRPVTPAVKPPLIAEPPPTDPGLILPAAGTGPELASKPTTPTPNPLPPTLTDPKAPAATPTEVAKKDEDLLKIPDLPPPAHMPERVAGKPALDVSPAVKEPALTAGDAAPAPPGAMLLNTTRCNLEYSLEGVQPAAFSKVDFWATRDNGRTWLRLVDDSKGRGLAQLTLPGEGAFGILIRANGDGKPPAAGEEPDTWVEVDTTKPFVNILPPTVGKDADAGTVQILWTTHDKNLVGDSITLSYATRPEGPWLPIVSGHKNEGVYRWTLPTGVGPQVHLRLEASDKAGNVGRTDLPQPVVLEQPRPRVRVLAVGPGK